MAKRAKPQGEPGRAQWGSSLGFVLAAASSAVGLGNIWKFPGRVYEGGGGTFLLAYVLIVFVLGAAVLLAELALGRRTQRSLVGALDALGHPRWKWVGGLGVLCGFVIASYYIQVGGWVLHYAAGYALDAGRIYADPAAYFARMLGQEGFPWLGAILCPLLFAGAAAWVLRRGVSAGIERFSKVAMPALLVRLLGLMVRAVTLPGAQEGVGQLFTLSWEGWTPGVLLSALGQAFYSLSLGMAVMVTYGSYLRPGENLVRNVGWICALDTLVALLAALTVLPAVSAAGAAPGAGSGFVFTSLTGVFASLPGGAVFGALFYLLLLVAALTSAISILEGAVAYVTEQWRWRRPRAICLVSAAAFLLGVAYTLSQGYLPLRGIWFDFAQGLQLPRLGEWMELVTDRLLMPLGALLLCLFVGWVWGADNAVAEIRRGAPFRLGRVWAALVRWAAPLAILAILAGGVVFGMQLS